MPAFGLPIPINPISDFVDYFTDVAVAIFISYVLGYLLTPLLASTSGLLPSREIGRLVADARRLLTCLQTDAGHWVLFLGQDCYWVKLGGR